jgi:5-formyltetrahydrofolate cyclo-ligase
MTKPSLIPSENNKNNSRTSIRKKLCSTRQALTTTFQKEAADALLLRLKKDIFVTKASHIALYLANKGELDLQPFIHWCWRQNKHIYLPIVHPFSKGHLLFLRYESNSTMTINRYNIEEPKLDVKTVKPIQQLDIIFTPLVAFDHTGARIGMGGGYYDRTLAKWHEQYSQDNQYTPAIIGVAHDCQQVEAVPHEPWDIPLPTIITPTRTIKCNN